MIEDNFPFHFVSIFGQIRVRLRSADVLKPVDPDMPHSVLVFVRSAHANQKLLEHNPNNATCDQHAFPWFTVADDDVVEVLENSKTYMYM